MSEVARVQHYVPRFILKRFAQPGTSKVWAYDKWKGTAFNPNIRKIAAEKGFYNLELDEETVTIEPVLAHLEGNASTIIGKIVDSRSLITVDTEARAILAVFLAVQFVRTKELRIKFETVTRLMVEKLTQMGATETQLKELTDNRPEAARILGIKSVLGANYFVPYFLNKTWVLFQAERSDALYISDNPVVMHNENEYGPYGNIGLAVKGIEIYFPISSRYCLGLLCHSIGEELRKAYYNMQKRPELSNLMKDPAVVKAFCQGVVLGTPVPLVKDNVTMLNSLQVTYSSRFVYCPTDDFSLVRRMIKDNPKYKEGLKPKVN